MEDLKKRILQAVLFITAITVIGTIGYRVISGGQAGWIDCAYMTVITLGTVGYGEIIDLSGSPAGRIFTILLILCGISGFLYFLSNVTAFLVEGNILKIFMRSKMEKDLKKVHNHYIVCGAGETGSHIIREFVQTRRPLVVIDINSERLENTCAAAEGVLWLAGDATSDDVLVGAGVNRARGLIACVGEDKDNLLITLSAKQLNEDLRIVTRCKDNRMAEKMKRSGASAVVSPNHIGGMRIASEMIRPSAVSFMDIMLRDRDQNLRIEDVEIPGHSRLTGKKMSEIDFRGISGLFPIALMTSDGRWIYNPHPETRIEQGMKLIIMGNADQRKKIEDLV